MTLSSTQEKMKAVNDLLERMQWILQDRGWDAKGWGVRAGLKSPQHVSNLMRRLANNPDASMDLATAAKLAVAANVSLDWLATGRGDPAPVPVELRPDPLYPTRGIALAAARIFGYCDPAIERVAAVDAFKGDPGLDFWLSQLRVENDSFLAARRPNKRGAAGKRRDD